MHFLFNHGQLCWLGFMRWQCLFVRVCVCPRAKKSNVSYLTPSSIWSKYGEADVKNTFKYNVSRSSSYRHCKVAFFLFNLLYKFQRFLTTDSSAGWGLWDCHVCVCKPDIFEANIMHVLQPFN